MFNKDFYPTPESVISDMLLTVDVRDKVILEPSAGSGNIVEYVKKFGAKEVLACELNDDLARIVSSKCRLLKSDFLNVESDQVSHIDLIIMNPPFSADDTHMLHAWDIAPGGSTIVSLCNTNTLKNTYSQSRKILSELINMYGHSENFGSCFDTAERKTGVSVSCVYLHKPGTGDDEFADFFSLEEEIEEYNEGILRYDYVRDIVSRYTESIKLFDKIMPIANKMNKLTEPISSYGIKFGAFRTNEKQYTDSITRETYKKELQKQCWQRIFTDMNMDKYVTKGVKETINKFVEKQVHVPFTMKNIYRMLEVIVGTHGSRMNQVLIEAFERICSYSHKNSTAGEKWKTNSDYMVNKKFIHPYICNYDGRFPSRTISLQYDAANMVEDIVKALCYLNGIDYDTQIPLSLWLRYRYHFKVDGKLLTGYDNFMNDHQAALYRADKLSQSGTRKVEIIEHSTLWGEWIEWGFFRIKGFKKGTMHFEFLDEDVWINFNKAVAKARGWRLPSYQGSKKENNKKGSGVELV